MEKESIFLNNLLNQINKVCNSDVFRDNYEADAFYDGLKINMSDIINKRLNQLSKTK